jgi:hypothetical protein
VQDVGALFVVENAVRNGLSDASANLAEQVPVVPVAFPRAPALEAVDLLRDDAPIECDPADEPFELIGVTVAVLGDGVLEAIVGVAHGEERSSAA